MNTRSLPLAVLTRGEYDSVLGRELDEPVLQSAATADSVRSCEKRIRTAFLTNGSDWAVTRINLDIIAEWKNFV